MKRLGAAGDERGIEGNQMTIKIRQAALTDLPYAYDICQRTAYNGQDASSVVTDPYILGHYFAAPYIVHRPDWCWMAEDVRGVVGYLVTAPNSRNHASWMNREWLTRVRELYAGGSPDPEWTDFEKWIRKYIYDDATFPDFVDEYPAHLHICILPRGQGQGWGSSALKLFEAKLKAEGRPGFHLGMAENNLRAGEFYLKQGLQLIRHDPGVIYFGKKIPGI
jgi:ribosomal protein S18 acetylase RimI-like enzyme